MTGGSALRVRGYLASVYALGAVALAAVVATARRDVSGQAWPVVAVTIVLPVIGAAANPDVSGSRVGAGRNDERIQAAC